MAERGRPVGSTAKPCMSCVPDSMRPFMRITALLSIKQLAEVMGVSYRSLLNIRCKNPDELPPAIKVGGVIRYRATDVDAWILSRPVYEGA